MTTKAAVIAELYRQVDAPDWAAPNLDALLDVLRDLSWRAPGPVRLTLPALDGLADSERRAVLGVLAAAVDDTIDGERPVHVAPAVR